MFSLVSRKFLAMRNITLYSVFLICIKEFILTHWSLFSCDNWKFQAFSSFCYEGIYVEKATNVCCIFVHSLLDIAVQEASQWKLASRKGCVCWLNERQWLTWLASQLPYLCEMTSLHCPRCLSWKDACPNTEQYFRICANKFTLYIRPWVSILLLASSNKDCQSMFLNLNKGSIWTSWNLRVIYSSGGTTTTTTMKSTSTCQASTKAAVVVKAPECLKFWWGQAFVA